MGAGDDRLVRRSTALMMAIDRSMEFAAIKLVSWVDCRRILICESGASIRAAGSVIAGPALMQVAEANAS